jgi:hypothetical protein
MAGFLDRRMALSRRGDLRVSINDRFRALKLLPNDITGIGEEAQPG